MAPNSFMPKFGAFLGNNNIHVVPMGLCWNTVSSYADIPSLRKSPGEYQPCAPISRFSEFPGGGFLSYRKDVDPPSEEHALFYRLSLASDESRATSDGS